jgi:hypothetical protein
MNKTPAYYRARLEVFKQLISEEVQSNPSKDSLDLRVLRNGVLPGRLRGEYEKLIKNKIGGQDDKKLRFEEITRFNTWFDIHPEKIAGTEVITSSIEFPIKIKGTEEEIIQTVTPSNIPDKKEKRIRLAKGKAMARKRSLELMKI